jgi:hypothetical protein
LSKTFPSGRFANDPFLCIKFKVRVFGSQFFNGPKDSLSSNRMFRTPTIEPTQVDKLATEVTKSPKETFRSSFWALSPLQALDCHESVTFGELLNELKRNRNSPFFEWKGKCRIKMNDWREISYLKILKGGRMVSLSRATLSSEKDHSSRRKRTRRDIVMSLLDSVSIRQGIKV